MAAKRTNSTENSSTEIEQKFSKEQICASVQYAKRRDLVDALLEEGKQYTKTEVDELIKKYMKGTVK